MFFKFIIGFIVCDNLLASSNSIDYHTSIEEGLTHPTAVRYPRTVLTFPQPTLTPPPQDLIMPYVGQGSVRSTSRPTLTPPMHLAQQRQRRAGVREATSSLSRREGRYHTLVSRALAPGQTSTTGDSTASSSVLVVHRDMPTGGIHKGQPVIPLRYSAPMQTPTLLEASKKLQSTMQEANDAAKVKRRAFARKRENFLKGRAEEKQPALHPQDKTNSDLPRRPEPLALEKKPVTLLEISITRQAEAKAESRSIPKAPTVKQGQHLAAEEILPTRTPPTWTALCSERCEKAIFVPYLFASILANGAAAYFTFCTSFETDNQHIKNLLEASFVGNTISAFFMLTSAYCLATSSNYLPIQLAMAYLIGQNIANPTIWLACQTATYTDGVNQNLVNSALLNAPGYATFLGLAIYAIINCGDNCTIARLPQ